MLRGLPSEMCFYSGDISIDGRMRKNKELAENYHGVFAYFDADENKWRWGI